MPVVVAPVLIPLVALILCLFLWAASQSGQTFFRSLFGAIGGTASTLPIVGKILGKSIEWLIHHTVAPISRWALAMEAPVVAFFLHLASVTEGFAFAVYYNAARTLDALEALRHSTIPRLLRAIEAEALHVGPRLAHAIHSFEQSLSRDVTHLQRYARTIEAEAARGLAATERALRQTVAGTLPRALPWLDKRAAEAEASAERAIRGLKGVRNILAAGVFAGLVIKSLARIGVGNVRCGNLKNINRRLCGAPPGALDDILGVLTIIVGTVSLIEFARACQTIEDEVVSGVKSFVRP